MSTTSKNFADVGTLNGHGSTEEAGAPVVTNGNVEAVTDADQGISVDGRTKESRHKDTRDVVEANTGE